MENDYAAKKSHLFMLVKMARADGELDEAEWFFIKHIADKMGLTDDELTEAIKADLSSITDVPKEEKDRVTYLYHLLFLMRMHDKISEDEKKLCRGLGFRLGFSPYMVDDMIELMIDYLGRDLPPDEMFNRVKKYLN